MNGKISWSGFLENQKGSVIVLLAVAMTVLLGCAALATDVGVNYITHNRLATAADAAAMAAGTKMKEGRDAVVQTALAIAEKNGVSPDKIFVDVYGSRVTVRAKAPTQYFFARLFGTKEGMMEQSAIVAMTRPTAFYKTFPLGVDKKVQLDYLKEVNLFSSELLGSGNWGALAFKDASGKYVTGASTLRENLKNGYEGLLSIGDYAKTESGVSMGPIRDAISFRFSEAAKTHQCSLGNCPYNCPRILIMPIYVEVVGNNANKTGEVEMVDFAAFWVSRMVGSGSNTQIWGHFIRPHVRAAASVEGESPYGLTTIKLIR